MSALILWVWDQFVIQLRIAAQLLPETCNRIALLEDARRQVKKKIRSKSEQSELEDIPRKTKDNEKGWERFDDSLLRSDWLCRNLGSGETTGDSA